jgi:hypothetical protein
MKICETCKQNKPFSDFNKNKAKKDGYGTKCRACMKIYRKEYYEKNKDFVMKKVKERKDTLRKFVFNSKLNKRCKLCGYTGHPVSLDYHHEDDTKEFAIAEGHKYGYSINKIKEEIKKCIILCANCHRTLHYQLLRE